MPLTSYDKKVLSSIFMIEKEGVIDFLDNIVEGSDILLEINDHTEDVIFKLQKLYRKGKTLREIQKDLHLLPRMKLHKHVVHLIVLMLHVFISKTKMENVML